MSQVFDYIELDFVCRQPKGYLRAFGRYRSTGPVPNSAGISGVNLGGPTSKKKVNISELALNWAKPLVHFHIFILELDTAQVAPRNTG